MRIFILTLFSLLSLTQILPTQFKVGIIIPLSGDLAGYGAAIRNGFELAKKEDPKRFEKIWWQYEDSRYDGKVAVTALTALRTQHNINLFYTWGVSPNEALLPIIESNKLATLAETTLKASTVGKRYIIRAARTGEMLAEALLKEFARRGIKKASIVTVEIPYYTDIIASLKTLGPKSGVSIELLNSYLGTDSDFRSSIMAAKRAKPDAVGVFLLPDQLISFFRQAGELNYQVQAFGSDIPDSQKLIDACPDNVNGFFFPSIGMTEAFRAKYTAEYPDDSFIGSAAQAYDIAMLIGDLFNNPESPLLTNDQIMKRITEVGPRNGATGSFRFTESADDGKAFRMPVAMKGVVNKKIVDIK